MNNRIITLFVVTLITLFVHFGTEAKKADGPGPDITFREKSHDFGLIDEHGGPVSYEFMFENTGTEPLVIISATASCGCTRPTYPTAPIKPGKRGTIKVTFLPEGRPGEFNKTIKVRTNAKSAKKFTLKITGTVKKR